MDQALADLISVLELEPLEENIFRGQSRDIGTPQVFGGQVIFPAREAPDKVFDAVRQVGYTLNASDGNSESFWTDVIHHLSHRKAGYVKT